MGKYKNQNKGYYWVLTAIEILIRNAFAILVYGNGTINMTKAVTELQFKKRFRDYPQLPQFDNRKEFYY